MFVKTPPPVSRAASERKKRLMILEIVEVRNELLNHVEIMRVEMVKGKRYAPSFSGGFRCTWRIVSGSQIEL